MQNSPTRFTSSHTPVFMPQPGAAFDSNYARSFTRSMTHASAQHSYSHPNAAGSLHGSFVPRYTDMLHATIAANSAQRFAGSAPLSGTQTPVRPPVHAPSLPRSSFGQHL